MKDHRTYSPGNTLLFRRPDDPRVLVRDGTLPIVRPLQQKKFAVRRAVATLP